jgi:hypothetical protein
MYARATGIFVAQLQLWKQILAMQQGERETSIEGMHDAGPIVQLLSSAVCASVALAWPAETIFSSVILYFGVMQFYHFFQRNE